jgi:hypothetical protein
MDQALQPQRGIDLPTAWERYHGSGITAATRLRPRDQGWTRFLRPTLGM